jgi:hemolysin III
MTHLVAAAISVLGVVWLVYLGQGDLMKQITLLIYGISLALMFSSSATYHLAQASPGVVAVLRKIDHAAIYLQIAGTYTPICFYFLSGLWRSGMLITIWSLAVIGIVVKIFIIRAPRWVTAGIYLVMGWLSIFAIREMIRTMPATALFWLFLGGIFYTVGAVIYILKKPDWFPGVFGFHEVWHIFVILGAWSHFMVMALFIA